MFDLGPHKGYIPAEPFMLSVEGALNLDRGDWSDENDRLAPLSQLWDMDDLRKMLGIGDQRSREWIPFGFADAILCKLNLVELWREQLADFYYAANLTRNNGYQYVRAAPKGHARCQRVGCSNTFPLRDPRGGRGSYHPNKRYCSEGCQATDSKHRRGSRSRLNRSLGQCPRGHDRSSENTYIYINSKGYESRRCRVCFRENQRVYRAQKEAA